MLDFGALLYRPIYDAFGVAATLTPAATGVAITITAIDRTAGIEVRGSSSIDVQTIRPAAALRINELTQKGLALVDLEEGTIEMNGKTWRIKSHLLKPSPEGELAGEVYLILIDESVPRPP